MKAHKLYAAPGLTVNLPGLKKRLKDIRNRYKTRKHGF